MFYCSKTDKNFILCWCFSAGKPLEQRCVRASPQSFEGGQHIYGINAEVEIHRDTPVWTPEPLLDITILTSANIQNITEQVMLLLMCTNVPVLPVDLFFTVDFVSSVLFILPTKFDRL